METVAIGRLVIFESKDGGEKWAPLKPADVPEWLNKPNVLGAMLEGCVARQSEDGSEGPMYCAVRGPDKIEAANDPLPENVSPILPAPGKHVVVPPIIVPGDAA